MLQWRFNSPIVALAADIEQVTSGKDLTITVESTGDNLNIETLLGGSSQGFFGFISDSSFTTINFTAPSNSGTETFSIDDVAFASSTASASVPFEFQPGMGIILMLGVFGVPVVKRKLKASQKLNI